MNDNEADIQAMLRLKGGDDLALNELMGRWQGPLTGFILRYTGNREDALDLAQETFVRVFEHRRKYEPKSNFSTWLFTIATNLCRNLARWRERHPTVTLHTVGGGGDSGLEQTTAAPGDSPDESVERDERAIALRDQIQKLPHDLKTAVLLFEYQDLGYKEIATALHCTPKAVETRLYRAREILRAALSSWKA